MYSKHHENRRQNAMKLFGMHKNYGGVLDASNGEGRVRKNMGGFLGAGDNQNINMANDMLRNSAENMGAKRGGFIHRHKHHAVKKANGGNVREIGMQGMSKDNFRFDEDRHYKKGGKAKGNTKHCHSENKRHERREHMMAEKHGHREKFAMGGVGKIRLHQMTLSGKPIPCHKGRKHHDA